ncbi:hypothetical protein HZS_6783 [Henneguya salminicola]|nr:hypothetical protein HZS_6783 [Henneguya salminicola]
MTAKRRTVEATKPPEPKFLTELKKKKGFVEPAKIEDKFNHENDRRINPIPQKLDELPVVILDNRELTSEETISILKKDETSNRHTFQTPSKSNKNNPNKIKNVQNPKNHSVKEIKLSFNFDDFLFGMSFIMHRDVLFS